MDKTNIKIKRDLLGAPLHTRSLWTGASWVVWGQLHVTLSLPSFPTLFSRGMILAGGQEVYVTNYQVVLQHLNQQHISAVSKILL